MESIRAVNGFPTQRGRFWIKRGAVETSQSLASKVFPWVDDALDKVFRGYRIKKKSGKNGCSDCPKTICGQGFLRILVELRTVFLQDSVALKKDYPDHPMFGQYLFQDPEYLAFEGQLNEVMGKGMSPFELSFRDVTRDTADAITATNHKLDATNRRIDELNAQRVETRACMQQMFSNR